MLSWTRLPRSIRCKYKSMEADVWPAMTLEGKKAFRYTIGNRNGYIANGTTTTEEEACRKCEELLEK